MTALTETEADVLRMLAGGMMPSEIAFALESTQATIEKQIGDIITKLEVSDTDAALIAAIGAGLIPTEL